MFGDFAEAADDLETKLNWLEDHVHALEESTIPSIKVRLLALETETPAPPVEDPPEVEPPEEPEEPMPPGNTHNGMKVSNWSFSWELDREVLMGAFANGDPYVVGSVAIKSSNIQPAGGRHGIGLNPKPYENPFDSRIPGSVASRTYPILMLPGDTMVCTQSWLESETGCPDSVTSGGFTAPRPCLKEAVTLTCLAVVPLEGSFRPAYCGDGVVRHNISQIKWDRLPILVSTGSLPSLRSFGRPWLDAHHAAPWIMRYLHPTLNLQNYGRDLTTDYNEAVLVAMCTQDAALVIRLIQIGIDLHGLYKNGARWRSDGGHGSGRLWPILFAGTMLGDTEMVNDVNSSEVGAFGEKCSTYMSADGHASWGGRHCYKASDTQENYRYVGTANTWLGAALGARLMHLENAWNHPAFFEYMDYYVNLPDSTFLDNKNNYAAWKRSWSAWVLEMWYKYRPTV
jgi:hypothetical protein